MCGVVGILEFSDRTPSSRDVELMTGRLQHRGPDGQGVHIHGPVALGHRRLSIIDLVSGSQPMTNEDGQVWITYNGELYNFSELRTELKSAGHTFRTSSDTEIIVHAWEEWGEACVERFRGMFAFAIADYRRRVVFLARDHLGIKPLYYFQTRQRMAFASELQALRALTNCPDEIDPKSVDDYLFLLCVPPPKTIYKDIFKLQPAHRMTIAFDGRTNGPEPYWKLEFRPQSGVSLREWTERLEYVLRDSVRVHLMSDVPFGAFLSGGIDSTAVVAMMSEEMTEPVKTFSIGFEEAEFNELEYARLAAQRFGTEHHEEMVHADAVSILPELVRHYGEPFGDSSAIPTYFVSRLARRHVTMALTGDGGDEAFLGYGRYFGWCEWVNPGLAKRAAWKRFLRPALQMVMPHRFPAKRAVMPEEWLPWIAGITRDVRREIWRPELVHLIDEPIAQLGGILHEAENVAPEQIGQFVDYQTYLPNDILTKVDIASMMHSLETRTPLTDVRVAEFAATMPWKINLQRNQHGALTGKHVLKRIVGKHFGPEFLERKKAGFGIPLNHWFEKGGALRQELTDRLCSRNAQIYRYLRPDAVQHLLDQHSVRESDNSQRLWQLLFLETWLDQVHGSRRLQQDAAVA
jgi:asparagine synthase (glutamine-hydrolysing)